MFDEECFFIKAKMTKSSQKKCQNCIPFLESTCPEMFDIKCQPELHLVDVWYQTSTRALSVWCLISIINRVATGSWLISIYSRYMFSLHFRVCRFQINWYTILTLFWLDLSFLLVWTNIFRQTSTKTVSGWCLISNVNQISTWLMFDIKRQPELYLVDVWYQSSNIKLQPYFGAVSFMTFVDPLQL